MELWALRILGFGEPGNPAGLGSWALGSLAALGLQGWTPWSLGSLAALRLPGWDHGCVPLGQFVHDPPQLLN